ncbi:MAG: hypothetical protein JWO62_3132 [Acidimicrobiaceae bacterium]|nr:hypothetical protein [Acidimicrobiaceae bacterium]
MIEFAIVGLGAWGLSVLERTASRARATGATIRVHVVQPGSLGGGVYGLSQPDYLVLNNPCSQLALYASPDGGPEPAYAASLYEWAVASGYRWVGYECKLGARGDPIRGTDYLPRRLMGEYLSWFYATLVASAPPNLEVVRHMASAVDIVPEARDRERLLLDDGSALSVDHVVLTSGHTWNEEGSNSSRGVQYRRPYPVEYFADSAPTGTPIAIAGMGLVAYDLITAMTVGRGGTFADIGSRKRYVRSGREPAIFLYSRSGLPYCAKSVHGVDPTGDYEPVVCTPELFRALTNPTGDRPRRQIDFRSDVLPVLFAEMQCRYLTHSAFRRSGAAAADEVTQSLRQSWKAGNFDQLVEVLQQSYGHFNPAVDVFASNGRRYRSSSEYESQTYDMIASDLDHALAEGGSPIKAAQEVTRILRDQLRSVIEFGGLSLESYVDFQSNVRGEINRIEAGPPALRSQQLLALLDAGIVRLPFGPAPELDVAAGGRVALRSTQLDELYTETVSFAVRGHLDMPSLARSVSPLLSRLYSKGRLTQLSYCDTPVGSVAISRDFHPFDAEGRLQEHLSLLGVLTEGVRYFTHYIPSPRSRIRAVLDAQACVESIIP